MQIRTRLTLQFALLVGGILITFSILIYTLTANYRKQEFTQRLKERAINTSKLLIEVKEINDNLLRIIDSSNYSALLGEEVVVFDYFKKSQIYTNVDSSSLEISETLLSKIRNDGEFAFRQGNREAIGLLYSNDLRRFVVIASAVDTYGITKLNNLLLVLLIGLISSIVLTILTGLFFSRQSLRPISEVVTQVSNISGTNLTQRVDEGNGTDEIANLAITFNKMLDRIENAFMVQKSFVSNASHELRTPLASVTSQIEVALMKPREASEYKEVLQSLLEDARSLTSLANNLLEIARTEQDIKSLKISSVRFDELFLQTQSDILLIHPEYNIETIINDNTEDEDQDLALTGNENLLKLIIVNLLDNACKFSLGKTVSATLSYNSDDIHLKVEDKGIGISKEDLPHIFEPFFRAQNAQKITGHGIGLSLIAKIVKLHNGRIAISSVEGEGTCVEVWLPYKLK
ncbi:MAG: two-component sensor histidine kinase [Bacteroidetes bacterium HGW-Bacteroidetes-9]|jgi:signal transduction histidine kinase|nr:MAG: two-component sensor histidine kinase [Bacteroidetes bacterium HGW-Bacteroidetes-9]